MKKSTSIKIYNTSLISCAVTVATIFLLCISFALYASQFVHIENPLPLTDNEQNFLISQLDKNYKERSQILSELPYKTVPVKLDIAAESAILIDTSTGSILYEKNADEIIPPASMTKLVEMYVVFDAVEKEKISLDDIVPLPKQSLAINMPSDASLMFLAEGQKVTLRELLLGLAIASGNDASIAVANYVAGSMDEFVNRMNEAVQSLGLTHTHFVESSGYSEKNVTTAKEFASFCRIYINKYPKSLEDFHSRKVLRYPLQHNLPEYQQSQEDSQAVVQYNTNKLLDILPGCDGLKTGFIFESGFNLALTAKRYGTRFLSVTMKGPGVGSAQGNKYRIADGTTLMEFAFGTFADYRAPGGKEEHKFAVGIPGAKNKSIYLVPALDETLTVPFITSDSPGGAAASVYVVADIPSCIYKETVCGKQYGTLTYKIDNKVLRTIPLVADRDNIQGSIITRIYGKIVTLIFKAVKENKIQTE